MKLSIKMTEIVELAEPHLTLPTEISKIEAKNDGVQAKIKIPFIGERDLRIRFQNYKNPRLFLSVEIDGFMVMKILPFLSSFIAGKMLPHVTIRDTTIIVDLASLLEEKLAGIEIVNITFEQDEFHVMIHSKR